MEWQGSTQKLDDFLPVSIVKLVENRSGTKLEKGRELGVLATSMSVYGASKYRIG